MALASTISSRWADHGIRTLFNTVRSEARGYYSGVTLVSSLPIPEFVGFTKIYIGLFGNAIDYNLSQLAIYTC